MQSFTYKPTESNCHEKVSFRNTLIFATLISLRYYSRTSILSEIRKIFKFPESIVIQYFTTTPSTHTSQYAFQKLSNDAVKAIVSCCKSYAFTV